MLYSRWSITNAWPHRSESGRNEPKQGQKQAELRLARAIRRLHGLGQNADAIAAALSVDVGLVRRVLSA